MVDLQRWRRRGGAGDGDGPAGEDDTSRFAPITADEWSGLARGETSDDEPGDLPDDADSTAAGGAMSDGPDPTDHAADEDLEDPYDDGYAAAPADDLDAEPDDAYAETLVIDEDDAVHAAAAEAAEAAGSAGSADAADRTATAVAVPTATTAGVRGGLTDRFSLREWTPLLLLQTSHPKQAIITALSLAGTAILTGRSPKEVGVIAVTVLVGQAILGWHNDVVDRRHDRDNNIAGKPVADGRLDPGTVWYAIVAAFWVLLPLAVTTGLTAGCIYMGSVAVGMLGNVLFRTGFLSFWSWAVSFAMLPAYLSYGGWGGQAEGDPPEVSIVVLAALLGLGVHFTRSVWGLVADHAEGWTYLPLKLGLKLGATRLLMLSSLYSAVIVVLLAVFGARDGLTR